ncbi:MAG: cyanophycinase [Bacteroidetes bacterium]|nr:cyanophycinase [Bacteroidota bacterium]
MSQSTSVRGTLIPIGGAEQKGEEDEDFGLDFIEDGILSRVVRECAVPDPRIVVIPTASSIPDTVGQNYVRAFQKLGVSQVDVLDIRKKKQSRETANLDLVRQAHCVMFSGGDQSRITKLIGDSPLHELLMKRFREEEFVLAGTSAGAMSMSVEMIAGGSSTESMVKGAVILRKGMGYIPQMIIDTHFIRRGRFGRLCEAVATFPELIGVGLSEDTGLVIKGCNEFEVIGSGMAIVFDPSHLTHNKHAVLKDGTPMSMSNLVTHILARGDRFTMDNRVIRIKPIAVTAGA